ncbi:MAG TPA: NHL repeat-containing protein, partial [Chthoniobacterales bacterium]
MKRRLFVFLLILIAVFLSVGTGTVDAAPTTIWISDRTDGVAGNGTATNPYDGHTAIKFDQIMRSIAPGTVVHIGPGTFQTTGSYGYNEEAGYYIPPGCKISGAGIDLTTIRNTIYPAAAGINGHMVWESRWDTDGAGIEISDLTVDCNWQNLKAAPASKLGAIGLRGNDCAIRRVRAINAYGNSASLAETFVLSVTNYYSSLGWQSVTGAAIEDCQALQFQGDYGVAISIFTEGENDPTIAGAITGCAVYDWAGTAAYGSVGSNGVTIINNQTERCRRSVYFDTGHLQNLEIAGNHFYEIGLRGVECSPSLGAALFEDVYIHDNFFEVSDALTPTPVAIGVSASGPGHEKHIRITNNTITKKESSTHNPIAGIATAYCEDLFVSHNWMDSIFQNNTHLTGDYQNSALTFRGNVDELGRRPAGLPDVSTAAEIAPPTPKAAIAQSSPMLYVADFGINTILRYDLTGTQTIFTNDFVNGPNGIALDSSGNVYVSTNSNTIETFSPAGDDLGTFASLGLNLPMALAFDQSGNLYAANFAGSTVEKFAPDGTDLGVFASVVRPTGLAFDATGNLYVASFGNTIRRFALDGTPLASFTSATLNNPEGLAFDSAGNLYVANSGSNSIEVFSPTGSDLGIFATTGLNGPIGLAFDSTGILYASSAQTATITAYATDGTASTFATTGFSPAFIAVQKPPTLVNISTRLNVLTGENVLDAG